MLIYRAQKKFYPRQLLVGVRKGTTVLFGFLLFFLALSFGINFIQSVLKGDGSLEQRIKTSVFETIVDSVSTIRAFYYFPRKVQNFLFNDVEEFQIYLSETDFGEISYLRNNAIQDGRLTEKHKKKFNVQIKFGDKNVQGKIRLKGDTVKDHLENVKWSMSFELPDTTVLTTSKFALQHPKRRSYLASKMQLAWAKLLGLPANKMEMVSLHLNNQSMGSYQFEEKWGTTAISREFDTDTVVVRFDDDAYMAERPNAKEHSNEAYRKAAVEVVDKTSLQTNELLEARASKAMKLLRGFQVGVLSARDVFDIEKVGIWLALGDIFGTWHGYGWGNLHFGYDPTKDRLVPLLWDMANENNQASPTNHLSARLIRVTDPYMDPNSPFWVELLGDDLILESYMRSLDTLTTPSKYNELLDQTELMLRSYLEVLQLDYPQIDLDNEIFLLKKNIEHIRKVLLVPEIPIYASVTETNGRLEVQNRKQVPVKILGIRDHLTTEVFPVVDEYIYIERARYGDSLEKKEILFERFGKEFSVSDFQSKKSLVLSMWGVENSIEVPIELIR